MNIVLDRWNEMNKERAAAEVLPCCGSTAWAHRLAKLRPLREPEALLIASRAVCKALGEEDWNEAFASHPRLGEKKAQGIATARSLAWSGQEQGEAMSAETEARTALKSGNLRYEKRFGRIFILCAQGRGTEEILREMNRRMQNDEQTELREAAEEQQKITELRLLRWLEEV